MNKQEAKRLVVLGTAGTAGITILGSLAAAELPPSSVAIGALAAGVGLAVVAEFWPNGAGTFALTMFATAAVGFGQPAWAGLQQATKKRPRPTGQTAAPAPTPGKVLGPMPGSNVGAGVGAWVGSTIGR